MAEHRPKVCERSSRSQGWGKKNLSPRWLSLSKPGQKKHATQRELKSAFIIFNFVKNFSALKTLIKEKQFSAIALE